ncbi:DUF4416 domain-containing protein [bacterium]|nr:MAG: DUF4416 domain-containing protein [bacterium]
MAGENLRSMEMAKSTIHDPVNAFVGVITTDESLWNPVQNVLSMWGEIDFTSENVQFDRFTEYYAPEMGKPLIRFWAAFKKLRYPEELVRMKWSCTGIENTFSVDGKRRINIDPGYLTEAKVVLMSFKDFSHRIYLTQGVYADMQLIFRNGQYTPREWTFADYKSDEAQRFFLRLRNSYRERLKMEVQTDFGATAAGNNSD